MPELLDPFFEGLVIFWLRYLPDETQQTGNAAATDSPSLYGSSLKGQPFSLKLLLS